MAFDPRISRAISLLALVALMGCSSLFGGDDDTESASAGTGERIAVMKNFRKLEVDPNAGDYAIELPPPAENKDWPQAGLTTAHVTGNLLLAPMPETVWTASIGSGSGKYSRLFAQPVVSGGKVVTVDSQANVAAFNAANGDRLWSFDAAPKDTDDEAMGTGVAVDGDVAYVATGFGDVLALNVADGTPLWRKSVGKPIRSAPTVAGGNVYVVTADNELHALSAVNGRQSWRHNGIAESAMLLGGSSPAVDGDSLVVAYSSGEVFNLRSDNGRVAWTDVLAVPEKVGALPAIADIRGLPIIDRGLVFAMSHTDRMAAIDGRTGERAWDAVIGGVNTPLVAGNAVFVVNNDSQLVALARENGRVVWLQQLQKLEDPDDRDSTPVMWWGPILAGGRLWLTNSLGRLSAYAPHDGAELANEEIGGKFNIAPIVADGMMFLLDDDGTLIAMR